MSWAIVRTCRRCGERAEKEITTRATAEWVSYVLFRYFEHAGSDDGCPSCDPELLARAQEAGIDLAGYHASVIRARNRGPA